MEKINTDLKNFRLNFSRCTNRDVAPLSSSYGTLRQGIVSLFLIAFCCWSSGTTPSSCPGFLCDRTLCLPFSQKCDHIRDCRDGSDERNCSEYFF